jgi:hypothetical protein
LLKIRVIASAFFIVVPLTFAASMSNSECHNAVKKQKSQGHIAAIFIPKAERYD